MWQMLVKRPKLSCALAAADPLHLPHLIGPMRHYLWILKTTHGGADMDTCVEMAKGSLDGEWFLAPCLVGLLWSVFLTVSRLDAAESAEFAERVKVSFLNGLIIRHCVCHPCCCLTCVLDMISLLQPVTAQLRLPQTLLLHPPETG